LRKISRIYFQVFRRCSGSDAVRWLLILGGLAGLFVLVCRWLRSGRDRLVPVAALGFGLVALATPPGAAVSARLGGGLVLLVQVLAWLLAPMVVVAGVVVGIVWLTRRQFEHDQSQSAGGRVGLVALTVTLGLAGAMALHHMPGMPAAGQDLRHAVVVLGQALLRQGEDALCTPPATRAPSARSVPIAWAAATTTTAWRPTPSTSSKEDCS
jgi:hypothetical protein